MKLPRRASRPTRAENGSSEPVHLRLPEERPIQHGDGDDAVELQLFQLFRVGHSRCDQSDGDCGDQVHEHGEAQRHQHDHEVIAADSADAGKKIPVDDVPTDLHEDAGQDGVRNRLHVSAETQHQRQQEDRPQCAGCPRGSAGAYVGHGPQGGPGSGHAPEYSRDHVADALTHQFPVRIVPRTGQRVGHQRSEEAVDRAQQGENEGRLQRAQ